MTDTPQSPFKTRVVLLLIAAGIVFTFGYLLLSAYGARLAPTTVNQPTPASRYATGYYALVQLTQATGFTVSHSGSEEERSTDALTILTPHAGTTADALARAMEGLGEPETPVLIILPKWISEPEKGARNRERQVAMLGPRVAEHLVSQFANIEVGVTRQAELRASGVPQLTGFHLPDMLQVLKSDDIHPLVTDQYGYTVLGEIRGSNRYILTDPDLVNNHGLADRRNARAAIALLSALSPPDGGEIAFDAMLHGATTRSTLQLMFEPPFVAVTVALVIAALMTGFAALFRFGPPLAYARALPFGKTGLIENIVVLTSRAHRTRESGVGYIETTRDWAARHLALPRNLQGDALDAHLSTLGVPGQYESACKRARNAKNDSELLYAAQALDDWRKGIKA